MLVQRQQGESFESFQARVHAENKLLEDLHKYESVLRPLVQSFRECYADEDWHWETGKLAKVVARNVLAVSEQLCELWGILPAGWRPEPEVDLPF